MPRIKSVESDDPEYHRREYKKYLSNMKLDDQKWGDNYEEFMNQMFSIFTDNPPHSWRFLNTTYKYPVFRVVNIKSGRTTYFLHVFEDRLIIPHKFFMEEFKPLFNIHNDFYGAGYGQVIDFSTFDPKEQLKYVKAIQTMLGQKELISLNYSAH